MSERRGVKHVGARRARRCFHALGSHAGALDNVRRPHTCITPIMGSMLLEGRALRGQIMMRTTKRIWVTHAVAAISLMSSSAASAASLVCRVGGTNFDTSTPAFTVNTQTGEYHQVGGPTNPPSQVSVRTTQDAYAFSFVAGTPPISINVVISRLDGHYTETHAGTMVSVGWCKAATGHAL